MDMAKEIEGLLFHLVCDLVNKEYKKIVLDGRNGELTDGEIKGAIEEYPGSLSPPPKEEFVNYNRIEIPGKQKYVVEFELWVDGEMSDLTLSCEISIDEANEASIRIMNIRVI